VNDLVGKLPCNGRSRRHRPSIFLAIKDSPEGVGLKYHRTYEVSKKGRYLMYDRTKLLVKKY
jgi:hypothetical protein